VVSFRGTEPDDPSDLAADANLLPEPWSDASGRPIGKVHRGFAQALLEGNGQGKLLQDLVGRLGSLRTEPLHMLLTGHSLGAALATLAASHLATGDSAGDLRLYTFGSPRVGDGAFAQAMKTVDHTRCVNCCDLVTRIPPERFGYVHTGTLNYIDGEGKPRGAVSDEEIAGDRFKAVAYYLVRYSYLPGTVWVREMADHSPINYLSGTADVRR